MSVGGHYGPQGWVRGMGLEVGLYIVAGSR